MGKVEPETKETVLAEALINARKRYANCLRGFWYLEHGGMAIADHKIETLMALQDVKTAVADINYYEKQLGMTETKMDIPTSRYAG